MFLRDVHFAVRTWRRRRTVAAIAIVTIAIGIGAATSIYSVVDGVLLRPLTYQQPERLVVIHDTLPQRGRIPVGGFEFEEWRRSAQSFDQMALMAVAPVILTGAGEAEREDEASQRHRYSESTGV